MSKKDVLPENLAMMANAAKSGSVANFSTEQLVETQPFNSEALASAVQAQAGLQASHMDFAAQAGGQAMQALHQIRQDLAPMASQLKGLRLPDTQVNIEGRKIEIPFEVKQYATDLDQARYNQFISALLGPERLDDIRKHCTKANQNTLPALWLNQAVCVETQKPYVYLLSRELPQSIKDEGLTSIGEGTLHTADQYLQAILGGQLHHTLAQIAHVNTLSTYVVFVLLVDQLLADRNRHGVPVTSASIWDGIGTEKPVEQIRPLATAEYLKRTVQ